MMAPVPADPTAADARPPHLAPAGPVLVTGAAGFIGAKVSELLLDAGVAVTGLDDLNDYYDPGLKAARLEKLRGRDGFTFVRADVADRAAVEAAFADKNGGGGPFAGVVHLAAQAGVRYSLSAPHAYARTNLVGFLNVLEACRSQGEGGAPPHLIYASSSSVYGANDAAVLRAEAPADHPLSLYAATKRSNELMAHSYAHLFGLPCSGVRFFSVYGPWGRPDMAVWKFTDRILKGEPIDVYGHGEMRRGFTYIDDAAEGVVRLLAVRPEPAPTQPPPAPNAGAGPFVTYNLGGENPIGLMRLVELIEAACGREAVKNYLPMQPGDVVATAADAGPLRAAAGFDPRVDIETGVGNFVRWFREYRGV